MWNCSRIFAGKVALLSMVAFGYLLLPSEAVAQEENTKKPFEKPISEESSTLPEAGTAAPLTVQKSATVKPGVPLPLPRKEVQPATHLQERESKKNESPSTLSFNIFLYIVDKFKQDQD
jgi:type IV secretory pathway VirB10-like protein